MEEEGESDNEWYLLKMVVQPPQTQCTYKIP